MQEGMAPEDDLCFTYRFLSILFHLLFFTNIVCRLEITFQALQLSLFFFLLVWEVGVLLCFCCFDFVLQN